jgi:hypothetical protein
MDPIRTAVIAALGQQGLFTIDYSLLTLQVVSHKAVVQFTGSFHSCKWTSFF